MSVIAKFRCNSVNDFGHSKEVTLGAVYADPDSSEEDQSFWKATPQGTISMRIDNPDASVQFEPGDIFYVSFEKAAVPA